MTQARAIANSRPSEAEMAARRFAGLVKAGRAGLLRAVLAVTNIRC